MASPFLCFLQCTQEATHISYLSLLWFSSRWWSPSVHSLPSLVANKVVSFLIKRIGGEKVVHNLATCYLWDLCFTDPAQTHFTLLPCHLPGLFSMAYFPHLFALNLYVFLYLKRASERYSWVLGFFLSIQKNLCLLMGLIRPLTFNGFSIMI